MTLKALDSVPQHMSLEEYERLQETTPTSFHGHLPVLRMQVEDVRCLLEPSSVWPVAEASSSHGDSQNGSAHDTTIVHGTLYITEESVSFLPSGQDRHGFSLDYPSLSLHAVSRSLPGVFRSDPSQSSDVGCIYCQLDLSVAEDGGDEGDAAEEGEDGVAELWILPNEQEKVEPLFEALSYCASLVPSTLGANGDGDALGHPFSSIGPFGTGLLGMRGAQEDEGQEHAQLEAAGVFDDAEERGEEDAQNGFDASLSESGRNTLARLDALLQWPQDDDVSSGQRQTKESKVSANELGSLTSVQPTNTLILVHLPQEVFHHPPLASALLDLLHAYGELHSWTPLPSFGRAIVVYEETTGAQRGKEALDRLLLPLMDEDEEEDPAKEVETEIVRKQESTAGEGRALRAYYGDSRALGRMGDNEADDHLPVPTTDRNFLISPPGSPPVGWEPIREDPPNTTTLADDLIRALGSLRDRGLGVHGHTPDVLHKDDGDLHGAPVSNNAHRRTPSASTLMPPPSILIPPRQTAVRSHHPLAQSAFDTGVGHLGADGEEGGVMLPGVTVQNVDLEQDRLLDNSLDTRLNKNLSISSVKATVESMRGSSATLLGDDQVQGKITPTARPPLGS